MPIIAIIGPSGAGKSTLVDMYLAEHPNAILHKTITTRPQRDANDTSHQFVADTEFNALEREGKLIYSAPAYGFRYGMPALPDDTGDIMFVLLRAQFIPRFRQLYPATRVIQIEAPIDVLMERLANRGDTKRINEAALRNETSEGKKMADVTIPNKDTLEKGYRIFCAELAAHEIG